MKEYIVIAGLISLATLFIAGFNRTPLYFKWAALWLVVTASAFFGGNVWVLITVTAVVSFLMTGQTAGQKIVYYFLLLPVVPEHLCYYIPGSALGINYLFGLTYPRMLTFFILIPALFALFKENKSQHLKLFSIPIDKFVLPFLGLLCLLAFRSPSTTEALRNVFYITVDALIPYYVISRSVDSMDRFKEVFSAIVFSAIVLSTIAIFEGVKSWLLYYNLQHHLDVDVTRNMVYLLREGFLRVRTTFGHPIPLGYFLVVCIALLTFLRNVYQEQKLFYRLALGMLLGALFFTISRGPWLGCLIFFLVFWSLGASKKIKVLMVAAGLGLVVCSTFFDTEAGRDLLRNLSLKSEAGETIDYRVRLMEAGVTVIKQNPIIGSANFLRTDEMEEMRQGEGIIDIVNTYLGVALKAGLVGLTLYGLIFFSVLKGLYRRLTFHQENLNIEKFQLGRALLSIVLASAIMFGSMGQGTFIPIYFWAIIALSTGFIILSQKEQETDFSLTQDSNSEQVVK